MSCRPRYIFALYVFLILYCVVFSLHSYYYGNREKAHQIGFKLNTYSLNASENKLMKEKTVFLDGFALTHYTQKHEKYAGKNIEHVQSGIAHAADRSKSSYSAHKCNCSKRYVSLSKIELPVTGLVSFPGSGNTWARHLIQQMTGIGTSSVYCDGGLQSRGFPYECETQKARTIVVKTHQAIHLPMFQKTVLLVRNPYDAILSYSNLLKAGHTGHPSKKVLIQTSAEMFNHHLRYYVSLIKATTRIFKGPVHVVQYERLKNDMAKELRSLATFLNANVTGGDIDCTVKCQEGNFHRQTSEAQRRDQLRSVYDREMLLRLQESVRTSEKVLKEAYNVTLNLDSSVELYKINR